MEERGNSKEQRIAINEIAKETVKTPEYANVRLLKIGHGKMMIGPPATDPEASYPAYEVYIDKETKVEGEKTSLDELREGDHVSIWTKLKGLNKEIAEKIVVAK